jgi:hypothetical protein
MHGANVSVLRACETMLEDSTIGKEQCKEGILDKRTPASGRRYWRASFRLTGLGGGCPACHTSIGWEEDALGRDFQILLPVSRTTSDEFDVATADAEVVEFAG